ncbi:hypothetical protein V6N11_001854 [Hibiscus sabdariffa]|uniref:Uncharacterized protein n=1 Tax=Hibiscus sabdariffa TaxID=183260 RepID=A0ABR2QTP0_9ROSI
MAGKVTVGIEDEGNLASTRILEMGLRGEGKIQQEEQSISVCNSLQCKSLTNPFPVYESSYDHPNLVRGCNLCYDIDTHMS